jgi:DNA-binding transcriptional LysR family regulator
MEIRQLRTFQTVARHLSFNKAAGKLNYAQSSISAQIMALEEELGVRLFDRLGRRILLTEAGKSLLQYAEKILDLADQTLTEIVGSKDPKGSLTIRVPETLGVHRLAPVIQTFRSTFPGVRLDLITCAHEDLQKDLRKGLTDLAFLLAEAVQAADLGVEVLGFESIVMVASPDHPLSKKRVVRTRDLQGETVLLSKVDCSYRRTFERILKEAQVDTGAPLVFHSVETLKRCVIQGVGVTVLPAVAVAPDIKDGKLVALRWEEGGFEVAVLMIWYKERWLSPTVKAFMDITRRFLKDDSANRDPA